KAEELSDSHGYFMPQQSANAANPKVHAETTGNEIVKQMQEGLDGLVSGMGPGGTRTGAGKVLREHCKHVRIYAVEPEDAAVLSGEEPGPHKIQGRGAGFVPEVLDTEIYDEVIKISNDESFEVARETAKSTGILGGISSGAAIAA